MPGSGLNFKYLWLSLSSSRPYNEFGDDMLGDKMLSKCCSGKVRRTSNFLSEWELDISEYARL